MLMQAKYLAFRFYENNKRVTKNYRGFSIDNPQ